MIRHPDYKKLNNQRGSRVILVIIVLVLAGFGYWSWAWL